MAALGIFIGLSMTEQAEYNRRWGDADEKYSASNAGYTPHFCKFMSEAVGSIASRPAEALEIGCGDGFFSQKLAELGCHVTGIDISTTGIESARKRCPGGTFLIHDLGQPLPFADGSMDVVWCSEVLEHLFSPLSVCQEIRRVLRPQGILLATVPYHGLIKNLGIALLAFERHYDPTYPHIRFFTKKSLSGIVSQAGLAVQAVSTCGSGLGFMGLRDLLVPTNILLKAQKPSLA